MTRLGAFRDRISLMREEKQQGAGGRLTALTPLIADVWAEVTTNTGSLSETLGRQQLDTAATFTTHSETGFDSTRQIGWQGRRYRITGYRMLGADRRFIEFTGQEILP